jgi:hypothetical protein
MNFTRITNDTNGNPRYVAHFLSLEPEGTTGDISARYARVCEAANKVGGRRYHNRSYGGGIAFVSYNPAKELLELRDRIRALLA